MKIAVISDIHDNVWRLKAALEKIREIKPEALVCCGDLCSPFIIDLLAQGYPGPIQLVFGNNDGDRATLMSRLYRTQGRVRARGELAEFWELNGRLAPRQEVEDPKGEIKRDFFDPTFQGKRIAVNHYDYLARPLAASGHYNLVFYGHNHQRRHEYTPHCVALNPGALMGYNGPDQIDIPATFVVYDTVEEQEIRWYEVVATSVEERVVKYRVREYNGVRAESLTL